jgi:hypothetical protein
MNLEIDQECENVAELMRERIAASRFKGTVRGLAAIAPLLWRHYGTEKSLLFSSMLNLLRTIVSVYRQLPTDWAQPNSVLVVILRRQGLELIARIFTSASHTSVDSRVCDYRSG